MDLASPGEWGLLDADGILIGASDTKATAFSLRDSPQSGGRHLQIVFDGIIYNTQELVRKFGFHNSFHDEASLTLAIYDKCGISFSDHLDGEYAYIISDGPDVVYGTDPLGIRPLYSVISDAGILLASTLQGIGLDNCDQASRVPPGVVHNTGGSIHKTKTGLLDLPWEHALTKAVQSRIPTSAPWGVLLSGGLDSSVICALATRPTITISSGLQGAPDLKTAQEVSTLLGTQHHQVLIEESEVAHLAIESIVATCSFEPWLVLGGIGTLAAARAARARGLETVLSGEGADELFAGYRDFDAIPADHLEAELGHQQEQLGATECLRLDRCTRLAGIRARVPFLAREVVAACRLLPPTEKRDRPGDPSSTTKVALRRFAETIGLPPSVCQRPKLGFSLGTGIAPVLDIVAEKSRSNWASVSDRKRFAAPGIDMDTATGAWMLGVWMEHFGNHLGKSWSDLARRRLVRT